MSEHSDRLKREFKKLGLRYRPSKRIEGVHPVFLLKFKREDFGAYFCGAILEPPYCSRRVVLTSKHCFCESPVPQKYKFFSKDGSGFLLDRVDGPGEMSVCSVGALEPRMIPGFSIEREESVTTVREVPLKNPTELRSLITRQTLVCNFQTKIISPLDQVEMNCIVANVPGYRPGHSGSIWISDNLEMYMLIYGSVDGRDRIVFTKVQT